MKNIPITAIILSVLSGFIIGYAGRGDFEPDEGRSVKTSIDSKLLNAIVTQDAKSDAAPAPAPESRRYGERAIAQSHFLEVTQKEEVTQELDPISLIDDPSIDDEENHDVTAEITSAPGAEFDHQKILAELAELDANLPFPTLEPDEDETEFGYQYQSLPEIEADLAAEDAGLEWDTQAEEGPEMLLPREEESLDLVY